MFLLVEASVSIIDSDNVVQVEEGGIVNLTCLADGVPRPETIIWFKNGLYLNPAALSDRVQLTEFEVSGFRENGSYFGTQSVLTISSVSPALDSGLYTCRSSNGLGLPAIIDEPFVVDVTDGE